MYSRIVSNVLFPLHESLKGHPTHGMLREMQAADRLSASELSDLRNRKLREFIAYCYAHVPYVRMRMEQASLTASDVQEAADLARLPIMTKADVRAHREALRSRVAGKLTPFTTGGSTGEPLVFDLSKRRIASRVACRQRISRWWGMSIGDPELAIWASPLEVTHQDWIRSLRDRLMATRLLSAYEMDASTMSRYLDVIASGRWRQIFTYPSTMYLLCLHARNTGRHLRQSGVKVVFVTSEVLFRYQRELIFETMGCPVADGYGGRDSGFISHECPQGGMHVMADATIAEIVDPAGAPVPPGQPGEIVVTDLYSHEAPFIRYATGDIGVFSERACTCGRALPLFDRIEGRSNDAVTAADGRILHPSSLVTALRDIEGVEQFRISQKSLDCFHVNIVPNAAFRKESEHRIRTVWSERLRSRVDVTFEYTTGLPRERSGKFRHFISELPNQQPPQREGQLGSGGRRTDKQEGE